MASLGGKIRKFAQSPWVRYPAAAMAGGMPAVAAMGARDIYKHVTNHPVGLGGLPAPHPSFPNMTPDVVQPPSNTSGLGLPKAPTLPDYMPPPPPAVTGLSALTPPSAPVNTSGLGLPQSNNNPNLFPSVIPPPVDTSGLGLPPVNFPPMFNPAVVPPPPDTSGLGMTQTPNLTNPDLFSGVLPPPGSKPPVSGSGASSPSAGSTGGAPSSPWGLNSSDGAGAGSAIGFGPRNIPMPDMKKYRL